MNDKQIKFINLYLEDCGFEIEQDLWIGLDYERVRQFISFAESSKHLKHKITRERTRVKKMQISGLEAYTELNKYVKVKELKDLKYSTHFKATGVKKVKEGLNSNIQQFVDKNFAGKVIKATSIDKNGAYLSWFKEPLPYKLHKRIPFEYGIRLKEDEVAFYITEDLEGCSWERPDVPVRELLIFKTKVLEGSDKLLNEYKKSFTKDHAVYSIGYLSRHSLLSSYIWYKQGELITKIKKLLKKKNINIYKGHTDSICFDPKGYKYVEKYVEDGTFKLEFHDKDIFICHQSAYQVEGEFPKGLKHEDMIDGEFCWGDGTKTKPTDFPCLKMNEKVSVIVTNRKTLVESRQWKTLLEIGVENNRE